MEKQYFDASDNTVCVSAKVSAGLKAKLLADAKRNDMSLSQYVANILAIEGENENRVTELTTKVRELEQALRVQKQANTQASERATLDAVVGISDTLAEMQEQLRELYDNQPQALKDRIEELEQELDKIREEQMYADDEDEEEVDEDNEENEEDDKQETIEAYKSIVSNLRQDILALEKRKETDCAKFQKLGEEAMAQIAMHQFGQVVSLVAQDYTWKEAIKKKMWATFRGLPKPNEAWDLVKNPYAKIKNISSSNEKPTK